MCTFGKVLSSLSVLFFHLDLLPQLIGRWVFFFFKLRTTMDQWQLSSRSRSKRCQRSRADIFPILKCNPNDCAHNFFGWESVYAVTKSNQPLANRFMLCAMERIPAMPAMLYNLMRDFTFWFFGVKIRIEFADSQVEGQLPAWLQWPDQPWANKKIAMARALRRAMFCYRMHNFTGLQGINISANSSPSIAFQLFPSWRGFFGGRMRYRIIARSRYNMARSGWLKFSQQIWTNSHLECQMTGQTKQRFALEKSGIGRQRRGTFI